MCVSAPFPLLLTPALLTATPPALRTATTGRVTAEEAGGEAVVAHFEIQSRDSSLGSL
jgi:hypothetical protein